MNHIREANHEPAKYCWKVPALICAGLLALSDKAAADVTLYGVLDVGVTRVSNENGHSISRLSSGDIQQSRFGFRGTESLGDGYQAFFNLENGFNADTGAAASSTVLFSRDARVGLSAPWGTLSLGRQAAPLVDALLPFTAAMLVFGPGYYTTHPGDYDRTLNVPVDNSVKYITPTWAGFNASLMYGFGEQAGSTSAQSTWSAGASYTNGPLVLGAGFLQSRGANLATVRLAPAANPFGTTGPDDLVNTYGFGASYKIDSFTVFAQINEAKFRISNLTPRTYEIGTKWAYNPAWTLGLDFTTTRVHGEDAKIHELALSGAYGLSKRTDVYVVGVTQKTSGTNSSGGPLVAQIFTVNASSTSNQNILRAALRHKF